MDGIGSTARMTGGNAMATATNNTGSPVMSSNNFFNTQLPTSLGGGSIGIDFGPNAGAIATGAYSFLNSAMGQQQGFLNSAIQGSQNFFSGLVKPATDAAAGQIAQNTALLPQLYQTLIDTNQTAMTMTSNMTNMSISAQERISMYGIKESSRVARRAGRQSGCFITTACCEYFGERDDCYRLTMLRKFRDDYMRSNPELSLMVEDYYATAPGIVEKIKARADAGEIFAVIRKCYLDVAVAEIEACDWQGALQTYTMLIDYARSKANG